MPTEPPPTPWHLSADGAGPGEDLIGVGADLAPGTVLEAYRNGLFPMGVGVGGGPPLGWWSPDPRGVLLPGDLHVSRSLRRSLRRFDITVDTAFSRVLMGCADPSRDGAWITPDIAAAYRALFDLGWAHSVEVWADGELVGGLYGLAIGRLMAGESMFHRVTDASKAALVATVDLLSEDGVPWVLDVQWQTSHLASLGVREVPRSRYLTMARAATGQDLPSRWRGRPLPGGGHVQESSGGDGKVSARRTW
jgi:leucyl/phenylalanyl-tRNA---protein transferase